MKYLITAEDLSQHVANEYTDEDFKASYAGYITIVRLSDLKQLINGRWVELNKWTGISNHTNSF